MAVAAVLVAIPELGNDDGAETGDKPWTAGVFCPGCCVRLAAWKVVLATGAISRLVG